ncbi:SUMF1/EgtB/PvdO family nonheme iron enzyme [Novosphingobium sp. FSY-8]|uniref:SUMF1/EgtB/PvdO family nonheme iron enzyme n=2 Tax=Novosphingobium ovatum TaxID=1908523 RepID=A0ABW9XBT0_9SPHN|nr:SUMF1/EgtB/PvdO family nonheme iron enzyme [Novosphingobium ovatum]
MAAGGAPGKLVPKSTHGPAIGPDGIPIIEARPLPPFPALRPGSVFADGADLPEMVVIPAGSFIMGSTPALNRSAGVWKMFDAMEGPQRRVTIAKPFAVGRYSVTFAQWDACVADGGCNGYRPDDNGWGRGRRPVINVNYTDAMAYVAWISKKTGQRYRLLSEAEWEYAARAGTNTVFWWGAKVSPDYANYGNVYDRTTEVGAYPANRFGLHDMSGNTAQWVADCHHATLKGGPTDGSAWDADQDCKLRNVRGGGWSLMDWTMHVAQRIGDPIAARNNHLGFRVARDLAAK